MISKKIKKEKKKKLYGYWKKWDNLVKELEGIIEELGHFPTESELKDMNRQDIVSAIKYHWGGLISVKEKMGHELTTKHSGYW